MGFKTPFQARSHFKQDLIFNMSEEGSPLQVVGSAPKPEAPTVSFAPSQAPATSSATASASAASGAPPAAAAAAAAATSNGAVADPGKGRVTEAQGLQVRSKHHDVTDMQQQM